MARLKICGITTLEDARYCAAAGADYLGFIQYEASPRFIDPEMAGEIIDWVHGPEPVGVFVNAPADVVNRVSDRAGFGLVQLHGEEPAFEVAAVERPVIKALRIHADMTADSLRRLFREYEDVADYFLLDGYVDGMWGGTGMTFDWSIARGLVEEYRVFIAGGIGSSNVAKAVAELNPFAIDVSSSLEMEPGRKDFTRVDAFFEAFEAAQMRQHEDNG